MKETSLPLILMVFGPTLSVSWTRELGGVRWGSLTNISLTVRWGQVKVSWMSVGVRWGSVGCQVDVRLSQIRVSWMSVRVRWGSAGCQVEVS